MLNGYNWKSLFATLCCTTRVGTPRGDAGTQGSGHGKAGGRSDLWQHALNIWVIHTYIGRVVWVCMYLHLFLGWHTNRFFAHSSHGNVDVEVNVVVGVVMLPFSYLQLFTLCQTNKHNQPYTHACTDACRLCMCVMFVCVCLCDRTRRARNSKKSEKQIAGIL